MPIIEFLDGYSMRLDELWERPSKWRGQPYDLRIEPTKSPRYSPRESLRSRRKVWSIQISCASGHLMTSANSRPASRPPQLAASSLSL
jgi:hypothetical protein